jgi:hypothetical protein
MILNDIENSGGVAPDGRPDGEAKNAAASPKKKKIVSREHPHFSLGF